MMEKFYFSRLLPELAEKSVQAAIRRLHIQNKPLAAYLRNTLSTQLGTKGSLLGDPVFEPTFGWQAYPQSMQALSGGLLSSSLIDAMDAPAGESDNEYRFGKEYYPYQHQHAAWSLLSQQLPQSLVVTSGTGSGKTECFLVPVLDDLVRESERNGTALVGVRALMIYPLNALIASQRDRLNAWTVNFGYRVRFCLYNGTTPLSVPQWQRQEAMNQVLDRESLRESPPPILVTNATMLEYMLVRNEDAPIIQASQGQLKWIILDEAHSYIGSKAAELALLLRRVMLAFDVQSEDVHFVATSATLGGQDSEKQLKKFLSSVSGLPLERVHVITGQRSIPKLVSGNRKFVHASYDELVKIDPKASGRLYNALSANQIAGEIRAQFVSSQGQTPQRLSLLMSVLEEKFHGQFSSQEVLQWLDLLSSAKSAEGAPFLPLRLHVFHNVLNGLWACSNPHCAYRKGTPLDNKDWPFGRVYFDARTECQCRHPVYEVRPCSRCHTVYLWANWTQNQRFYLVSPVVAAVDDFSTNVEQGEPDTNMAKSHVESDWSPLLILPPDMLGLENTFFDAESFKRYGQEFAKYVLLNVSSASMTRSDELVCHQCGTHHLPEKPLFRPLRLGAPFFQEIILPVLLKYCPAYVGRDQGDVSRPYQGKRLITFTDSRQGTARIALKCQQDSERRWLQSQVYRRLLRDAKPDSADAKQKILYQLENLRLRYETTPEAFKPMILGLIKAQENELQKLDQPQGVSFKQMVYWLKSQYELREQILPVYRDKNPEVFNEDEGAEALAKIMLLREFARRPYAQDNLETLGLVSVVYPKLQLIQQIPDFQRRHLTMDLPEWRNFLKITLDFFIRHHLILRMPNDWLSWSGNRIPSKVLISPNVVPTFSKRNVLWPKVNTGRTNSKLVRLLTQALKANVYTDVDRDAINQILILAFEELKKVGLLQKQGEVWLLDPEDFAFIILKDAWVCPVTGKVLDVTLKEITSLTPKKLAHNGILTCQPIVMPCVDRQWQSLADNDCLDQIKKWLVDNEQVTSLRCEGYWHDLHDQILVGVPYSRVVEHSAQQTSQQLRKYEADFRQGKVNIMSCSTTMEMGVDIGGISVVSMNNVPPHPANYLQRAGRAGRRGETRSVVLTICKNTPHDQFVLNNPLWPFITPMSAPRVSLNSETLVQRHIHSYLLSLFLQQYKKMDDDLLSLEIGWWMLPVHASPSNDFLQWLLDLGVNTNNKITLGLKRLLNKTCQEEVSVEQHIEMTVRLYNNFSKKWFAAYKPVNDQLIKYADQLDEKSPVLKSMHIQERRLFEEYLLTVMLNEGFLPAYGFPTHVVTFETLNLSVFSKYLNASFEHNRELPSRDSSTGLIEYAPSAKVVIDGLVYQSEGITLNWHEPSSNQDISEIQNIRQIWQCECCGSSMNFPFGLAINQCTDCGSQLSVYGHNNQLIHFPYLDPAGFAVDIYAKPHSDLTAQRFVPPERPLISATGEWTPLDTAAWGFYRVSEKGRVFHYTSGSNHHGYAVCLSCGRAEEMTQQGQIPNEFATRHIRLRGCQGRGHAICEGSENQFSIVPNLRFGHEYQTDVLELFLLFQQASITDKNIAFTLAVAMRNAAAGILGVEVRELGCEVKWIQDNVQKGYAIILYDINASGYTTSLKHRLKEILHLTQEALNCPLACESSCPACLQHFDLRFRTRELNRQQALKHVKYEWSQSRKWNLDDCFFSPKTLPESSDLLQAISRELNLSDVQELKLFMNGDPTEWNIEQSQLMVWIHKWLADGHYVKLVFNKDAIAACTDENKLVLNELAQLSGISFWQGDVNVTLRKSHVCAEVVTSRGSIFWAESTANVSIPSDGWGNYSDQPLWRSLPITVSLVLEEMKLPC
ncbi:MAG: DEAD/DEAH box helicase [Agitococcus sp.]|nr:DEAD/DEAH box helicase [Agitococcus sp.]